MNIEDLLKEIIMLKEENTKLKSQLESYNNSRKSYYEKNKEHIKSQAKEGLKKLAEENPDKLKEYVFPSGRSEKVQGAEPYALTELLENINENDIVVGCKNVPNIWYNDKNGKKHRHYVDIFIPSQNRCIEVKSTWTEKININNIFLHLFSFQTPII